MALSRNEVRSAFLDAILLDYADIPPAEEISLSFSDRFLAFMAALIEEEKRGSWRLLSRQRRRALVVAAILAVSLLLVACTPTLRNAVSELVVTIYERFVDYKADADGREEIETVYGFESTPEGFTFVSQITYGPHFIQTTYQDSEGRALVFGQTAFTGLDGTVDNEQGETLTITKKDFSVLVYSTEAVTTADWIYDGYHMALSYFGRLEYDEIEVLVSAISPVKQAN